MKKPIPPEPWVLLLISSIAQLNFPPEIPAPPGTQAGLIDGWLARDPEINGANGPPATARALAAAWRARTGGASSCTREMAMHSLTVVADPPHVPAGRLRAAERAWQQGGRFAVVLAGPEMPNFQSFWRGHRPSGRVIRLGILDAKQKRDFFAALDVFALPSRSDSFGLVLLEAWANGVPNIGYRAGGIGWVIRDEKDGLLVRCGDVNGLAAALRRLSADAELRQRLVAAGLERTRREFEWTDKLALVRRVYEEVRGKHVPSLLAPQSGMRS